MRESRQGLTLVETLVIIGMVAALLGFLLPAIQRVRETANAMVCSAHLGTIGKAIALMTSGNQVFPMGGSAEDEMGRSWAVNVDPLMPTRGVHQDWGWAYQLLPYLGREDIWQAWDGQSSKVAPPEQYSYQIPIAEYLCPTRARGSAQVFRESYFKPLAAIDYAGNGGSLSFVNPANGNDLWNRNIKYAPPLTATTVPHDGIIGAGRTFRYQGMVVDRPLRPAEVSDGLSHTLLVAEKRINVAVAGSAGVCAPQPGDRVGYSSGFGTDTVRTGAYLPQRDSLKRGEVVVDGFGSSHPHGFNALFTDGSVRRLTYRLTPAPAGELSVMQRLCHRADGAPVNLDSLD